MSPLKPDQDEDFTQSRFLLQFGSFGSNDEDAGDIMGFYPTLEEAKADTATDANLEEHGWHILDNFTGVVYNDDGQIITDPPPRKRRSAYEVQ